MLKKSPETDKTNISQSNRKLRNRVSFVLNHSSEEDKKDSLKEMRAQSQFNHEVVRI